ncbi:hypothetical protein [Amorphus orientalis]|uniref:Uncharacterized protein n=1 Tax=Amorphus orientalis TaxID=649198 RepID=A0AAE3VST2_9HYPH|nr:hypothetical protein [Amorphus orientalis]MDQ0317764.1 hypothetical protein [Amorphus orientalis]
MERFVIIGVSLVFYVIPEMIRDFSVGPLVVYAVGMWFIWPWFR